MKTDIGKFKEQLSSLMTYISGITNNNSIIEKLSIKATLGISANPREIITLFADEVSANINISDSYDNDNDNDKDNDNDISSYADEILRGNDKFFLKKTQYIKGDDLNMFNDMFNNLKELWLKFSTEECEKIIRYFKLLVILSCMITKNEQLRLIINKYRDISNPLVFDE